MAMLKKKNGRSKSFQLKSGALRRFFQLENN